MEVGRDKSTQRPRLLSTEHSQETQDPTMFSLQVLAVLMVVAAVSAYPGYQHYPLQAAHHEPYAHPHYEFKYGVNDPHTGDVKNQWESRDGDVVKGSYSLVEPDGSLRTVHYTADKHNGFNAIVHKSGHGAHPQHYGHNAY